MTDIVTRSTLEQLRQLVRDVPDFPKPGIVFKDITPLLADANALRDATARLAAPWSERGITHVAAIESRGFILGAPVAIALGAGFIPVRKPGKLPYETTAEDYALEYGTGRLEVHADACAGARPPRVLIVDDVLATGGTAAATASLIERVGGEVAGFAFLLTLEFLGGRERLGTRPIEAILTYA